MPLSRRAFATALSQVAALLLAGRVGWEFFLAGGRDGVPARAYLGRAEELAARLAAERAGYLLDDAHRVVILPGQTPGALQAMSLSCTHLGCALHPSADNQALECPCHGSRFRFLDSAGRVNADTGQVLQGPATRPLDRRPVIHVGDRLFLEA